MTNPTMTKPKSGSSDKQSASAARKADTQTSDAAGVFLQNPAGHPDISMLGTDAFADFDEVWDDYTTQGESFAADDGAEPAVALLLPAVQAAREAADDAFDFAREEGVYGADTDDGATFIEPRADDEGAARYFSEGGASLYASPDNAGDQTQGVGVIAALPPAIGLNVIVGTNGGDWIEGTDNADLIFGLAGNDAIFGRRGADSIFGGEGSDSLFGGRGHDTIAGDEGSDYIDGGSGGDWLLGDAGNDTLLGQGGDDNLDGGSGNDLLAGGGGNDDLDGGSGIDTVSFAGASSGIQATLWFAGQQNTGQGWDTFADIENAIGSNFDDFLSGDDGGNWLQGRDGDDWLNGGNGNDVLTGGNGDDELLGGAGNDIYDGGAGNDTASFVTSAAGVIVDLGVNGPQNTGQGIDSFLSIENIYGSSSGDLLRGTTGANDILGGSGNDWMWGSSGNDNINGQDGADVLSGGAGDDGLTGGSGADAFVYGALFGDGGDDVVHDFEAGTDNVFVEIGFGISDFSDVTIAGNGLGDTVASFNGVFGGSLTFLNVTPDQIGEDDFFFI